MATSQDGDKKEEHAIFTTDPAEWLHYLYKEVCLTTESGACYSGRIYTVDPVSQTIVLARFDEQTVTKFFAVLGHTVKNIVITDDDTQKYKQSLDSLFRPKDAVSFSPKELKQKKEKLRLWLLKNRIPVVVSEDKPENLMISDALTIEPPYLAENCQSTNEIILGRIQGLVTSMPKDAHQW